MRLVRSFLLALLVSLLVGFAIGTWLRLRLERRPVYIGLEVEAAERAEVALLSAPDRPTARRALPRGGSRAAPARTGGPTAG